MVVANMYLLFYTANPRLLIRLLMYTPNSFCTLVAVPGD